MSRRLLILALALALSLCACARQEQAQGERQAQTQEAWRIEWQLLAGELPISGLALLERAAQTQATWREERQSEQGLSPAAAGLLTELLGALGGLGGLGGGAGLLAGLAGLAAAWLEHRRVGRAQAQAQAADQREAHTARALDEAVVVGDALKRLAQHGPRAEVAGQVLDEARQRQQRAGVREKINGARYRQALGGRSLPGAGGGA
jgi:hypothetical protein